MSYSLGDELESDVISSCCSAGVIFPDRCDACYENCSAIKEGEEE